MDIEGDGQRSGFAGLLARWCPDRLSGPDIDRQRSGDPGRRFLVAGRAPRCFLTRRLKREFRIPVRKPSGLRSRLASADKKGDPAMKKTLMRFPLSPSLPAGAALADDDDCSAPRGQWQPARPPCNWRKTRDGPCGNSTSMTVATRSRAATRRSGYRGQTRSGDAANRRDGHDEDDDDDDDRGGASNPAPAGTVAPPRNGLFGNGAPPQVQVN